MFDVFLAELLILVLMLLTSLRIFFTKRVRVDSTAILAPISFFFSLLLLYVWGADVLILALCAVSFFLFLVNIRSLLRLSARLYVDHYNVRFIIPTVLIALLSLALLFVVVVFRPVRYTPADFGVTKTKTALVGTLTGGYKKWDMLYDRPNVTAVLYEYKPSKDGDAALAASEELESAPTILFVPRCTANVIHYEPYFLMLAQRGYRVLSVDVNARERRVFGHEILNTRFFRRLYSQYLFVTQEENVRKALDADTPFVVQAYAQLVRLALAENPETPLFFAFDGISSDAVGEKPQNVLGSFWLNRIDEYKTADFGFLEQIDPLFAHFFGLEREKTFFIPRYVAGKTIEAITQAQKLAEPAEIIKGESNDAE